jgi:ankyrin repeat protein
VGLQAVRRLVSDGCGDMAMNLHDAAANGDVTKARRLVAAGADVEEQRGEARSMPLHWAAEKGAVETVKVLVDLGADKEAKDVDARRCMWRHPTGTWR